jgi:hypothetical protein
MRDIEGKCIDGDKPGARYHGDVRSAGSVHGAYPQRPGCGLLTVGILIARIGAVAQMPGGHGFIAIAPRLQA